MFSEAIAVYYFLTVGILAIDCFWVRIITYSEEHEILSLIRLLLWPFSLYTIVRKVWTLLEKPWSTLWQYKG
jgi:hypothetical protein